jgi:arylsulfatase A-like enzyme
VNQELLRRHRLRRATVAAAVVALAVVGVLALRRGGRLWGPSAVLPRPVRVVVLALGPGFATTVVSAPPTAFARLAAAGRPFERAVAPSPDARTSRAAVLRGLADAFHARGALVGRVGPGTAPEDGTAWDLAIEGSVPRSDVAARLREWLDTTRDQRTLLVAGLGAPPGTPLGVVPAPDPAQEAPPVPRIAAGDLSFGARPGEILRPPAWSEAARRQAAAVYLGRTLEANADLEKLIALLRRGVGDDFALVTLGDPSPDLGDHGILRRAPLFDATLRVDLVVSAPGIASPGRPSPRLVASSDVVPTLLDLAGLPPEPALGSSLMPLVADPAATWTRDVLSSAARRAGRVGRSVRTARHRYSWWPDGSEELYDHAADPLEIVNVASRREETATIRSLRAAIARLEEPPPAPPPRLPAPIPPPNVLLVIVDDLTTRVGAWGAAVETPNLDRLARRGVRFERAYVPVAMCSPSRTSMLMGWRPERTGVWNNLDPSRPRGALPLQEDFHDHGYFTAGIGKVYHQPRNFRWDWTDADAAAPEGEEREDGHEPAPTSPRPLWERARGSDEDQPDGQRALAAARIIRAPRRRPFFLTLGFVRPHTRWVAPARYFDLYPPASIVLQDYPEDDLADVPAIAVKTKAQLLPGLPLRGREPAGLNDDPVFRREAIAAYQSCVTFMDAQLGVVLDALDARDLWKSTIVLLVGDNGFHLGEHRGLFRKDTLFEEGLRVPFIVVAPGIATPGSVVSAPVSLLDLYPTLVDLAGLPARAGLDGRTLRPLLENPGAPGDEGALSYRRVRPPRQGWSLRTERFRYTLWPDGSEELYDHDTDPDEHENLAPRPSQEALRDRLRARLAQLVQTEAAEGKGGRR